MIRGIIYMYTSPNGKSYIGQTINEALRRKLWNSVNIRYAGNKINRARAKYGSENFQYTVLFEKEFTSKEIAVIWLNIAEQYYIQKYNTIHEGYNYEQGGLANANHTGAINHHHGGYVLSEEAKANINKGRAWQSTPEGRAKMSAARKGKTKKRGYRIELKYKPIIQLSSDGIFIMEFPSIRDAGEALSNNPAALRANISAVCNGKRETAGGYKWMYKTEYLKYISNES